MGDIFKEQLVKKEPNTGDTIKKVGIILLAVIISLATLLFVPTIAFFVIAAVSFGAYYIVGYVNKEYEYIFTNGELDIDCISNRTKRKRMFSAYVKDFEIMAHVEDKEHIRDFDSAEVIFNFSSGKVYPNTYAVMINYKQKRTKIIIEPNDKILDAIATVMSPRKLFKAK